VGLDVFGAEIMRVVETLDAGGELETARAHETAIGGIKRKRRVAAAAQRKRQAALDPARCNAGDEIGKAAERARGQAREHVIFGEPARPAIALGQKLSRLAVPGLETPAVAR